ncbi:MAG TPA: hypothetical protein DEQ47_16155 [Solibacterales bacterium]|nr:hypothetical protein [Bryobacterales bacterium]
MKKPAPGFKLGTENKKQVYILAGLGVVAVAVLAFNFMGGDTAPSPAPRAAHPVLTDPALSDAHPDSSLPTRRRNASRGDLKTWTVKLGPPKGGHTDPSEIDPTLRLDLLAKLQSVEPGTAIRNLFQVGPAAGPAGAPIKNPPKIIPGPVATAPPTPTGPVTPTAPPIDLKYYGYSTLKGETRRKAFLLDGEDIIMAFEGETVKKRYKVVKINATSVTMEDTQFKNTQTLPLQPEANG